MLMQSPPPYLPSSCRCFPKLRSTDTSWPKATRLLAPCMGNRTRPRRHDPFFGKPMNCGKHLQAFWREHFPRTVFWKGALARLVPVVQIITLPLSLLEAFVCKNDDNDDQRDGWERLLLFLSPITITGGLKIKIS